MTIRTPHAATLAAALAFAATQAFAASQSNTASDAQAHPVARTHDTVQQSADGRSMARQAEADYQKALAACKKMPSSMQTTCVSEAGNSTALAREARRETSTSK